MADDELPRAVAHGIVKINVGTILNVTFTRVVRNWLAADEDIVDPRRYLSPARTEMAAVVSRILTALQTPVGLGTAISARSKPDRPES